MRFKRVFGCVGARSVGPFTLSDTPAVARDLEWFIERYPLVLNGDSSHLSARSAEHRERTALVDALLARRVAPPTFDLAVPPREYQREAAALALAGGSLLLADDVGLGKTCSAICTFADPRTLPALVVTLTHLPRQWREEITKFAPRLKVHIIKKATPYDLTAKRRAQISFDDTFPDVVIINYHKLFGWAETLAPIINSVVFDECQELRCQGSKKKKSAKYAAARLLAENVSFRQGLSATPIYNYGGEIYNVMDCIAPGALGTSSEFATEWCGGWLDEKSRIKNPKAFGAYMRDAGLMLRRTRHDVARELPALQRITHHIEADEAALESVSFSCRELAKMILATSEAHRGQKMQASEELSNKLRQATGIAKAPYVAEFVRLLIESGEKVVLYGWHRDVYSIWLDKLGDLKPALYTGSESVPAKEESKRRFVAGETSLLVISLRSGAGLDGLQAVCRTVVFGELDWSPGVHEQNIGRVYRDGQADPVTAYFLVADSGADPVMAEVLGLKRQQIEGLRDPELDLIEQLDTGGGHIRKLAESYLEKSA